MTFGHAARCAPLVSLCALSMLSSLLIPAIDGGPALAQGALPSAGPFAAPTEVERDIPQLPPGFEQRVPIEPEQLLTLVLEGSTGFVYQNNVFRAPDNKKSDMLWVATPRSRLIYDGPDVDGQLIFEGEIGRYFDVTENDYIDFGTAAEIMWGSRSGDFARARAAYGRQHQAIGADIDEPERQAAEVTEFWRGELFLEGAANFRDFFIAPEARVRSLDYRDSERLNGTRIDNQVKNRVEIDSVPRLGWSIGSDLWLVLDPGFNARFYDEPGGGNEFDRDSVGLRPRAGLRYGTDLSPLTAIFTAGLALQDYDDSRLDTITTLGFLGRLRWRTSEVSSFDLDVERDIGETIRSGFGGTIYTRGRVRYVHTVAPQLDLALAAEAERREFEPSGSVNPQPPDRTDKVYKLGAEAIYSFARFGFAGIGIDYVERDSTDPDVRFEAFEITARVGARF